MTINLKKVMNNLKWNSIGFLGNIILYSLCRSLKIKTTGYENVKQLISTGGYIFAVWHSRMILVNHICRGKSGIALISSSKDGEIVARLLEFQGHESVRGSSTRGGIRALLMMIRNIKENKKPGLIIPDGPVGPANKVKPGIVYLAKETGYPIIPVTYSGEKIKVLSSWDKFIIPFPFTSCIISYGKPVYVPPDMARDEEKIYSDKLETELNRITDEADLHFEQNIL